MTEKHIKPENFEINESQFRRNPRKEVARAWRKGCRYTAISLAQSNRLWEIASKLNELNGNYWFASENAKKAGLNRRAIRMAERGECYWRAGDLAIKLGDAERAASHYERASNQISNYPTEFELERFKIAIDNLERKGLLMEAYNLALKEEEHDIKYRHTLSRRQRSHKWDKIEYLAETLGFKDKLIELVKDHDARWEGYPSLRMICKSLEREESNYNLAVATGYVLARVHKYGKNYRPN